MSFPVELERKGKGLVFKVREVRPKIINARLLGEPFDMVFEDRVHGTGSRYGGSPRYGNFGEQWDAEIKQRGLTLEVANAYLAHTEPRRVSEATTIYGEPLLIDRPKIDVQRIQLYSIDNETAKKQRVFIAAFVMANTS